MNVKLILPVLILYVIAFKFVYFISDQFRSVKQFSREVSRQEMTVSCATAQSATLQQFAVFGNARFCYDVNKEFTKMHELAMTSHKIY